MLSPETMLAVPPENRVFVKVRFTGVEIPALLLVLHVGVGLLARCALCLILNLTEMCVLQRCKLIVVNHVCTIVWY